MISVEQWGIFSAKLLQCQEELVDLAVHVTSFHVVLVLWSISLVSKIDAVTWIAARMSFISWQLLNTIISDLKKPTLYHCSIEILYFEIYTNF